MKGRKTSENRVVIGLKTKLIGVINQIKATTASISIVQKNNFELLNISPPTRLGRKHCTVHLLQKFVIITLIITDFDHNIFFMPKSLHLSVKQVGEP